MIAAAILAICIASEILPTIRARVRETLRLREEPVDEWILSLDGKDLAVLIGREFVEMFWHDFRLTPVTREDVSVLTDEQLWWECRFTFRHRLSGRVSRAFGGPARQEADGSLRVVLRGLY